MARLSSIACTGSRSKKSVVALTYQSILASKPPWGRYSAASWVSGTNTLTDLTGNGRSATTSGVASGSASGNGATASIAYLAGSTTATIAWPAGSIPINNTICFLTRYATGTNALVMAMSSNNGGDNIWYGHDSSSKAGIMYFNTGYKTPTTNSIVASNWLNFCTSNGLAFPNNILANGSAIGTGSIGPSQGVTTLGINKYTYGGPSDFQFSQLIIWDQVLTATELVTVSNALNTYLSTGVLQ